MTQQTPHVRGALLTWSEEGREHSLDIDDITAWMEWLDQHTVFSFEPEGGGPGYTARRELVRGRPHWFAYQRQGGGEKRVELGARHQLTARRLNDILMLLDFAPEQPASSRTVSVRLEGETRDAIFQALKQLPQVQAEQPRQEQGRWVVEGRVSLPSASGLADEGGAPVQCTSCGRPTVPGSYLCEACMVSISGLE